MLYLREKKPYAVRQRPLVSGNLAGIFVGTFIHRSTQWKVCPTRRIRTLALYGKQVKALRRAAQNGNKISAASDSKADPPVLILQKARLTLEADVTSVEGEKG